MYGLKIRQKKELHIFRNIVLLILFVALLAAGAIWFQYYTTGNTPSFITTKALLADPRVSEADLTEEQVSSHRVPPLHPRYISITKLGISNVRVFSVGVDKNNVLGSPDNIHDASWYEKSATPGSGVGAVLIDAHNGGITKDGVFAKLNTLKKGDEITVDRGDRKTFRYEVVENQSMSLEEVNKTGMKMMMESAEPDKEGLNLITCDGKWVPRYKQFDRRIMLRAVQIKT